MTLTIETNKRSFINAIVTLCKSAGIVSYKVEDTKQNTQAAAAENNENELFLIAELKKRHKENRLGAAMSMEDFYKEMANPI
jgi:hypothetical protein